MMTGWMRLRRSRIHPAAGGAAEAAGVGTEVRAHSGIDQDPAFPLEVLQRAAVAGEHGQELDGGRSPRGLPEAH